MKEKSTSVIKLDPTKKEKEAIDKTSVDKNSKAPAINYPKKTGSIATSQKETAEIELKFSEPQLLDRGKKLCKTLQEKGALEDEKNATAKGFKDKIDAKQTEIEILTSEIQAGFETKKVSCEIVRNFDSGKREYMYQGVKVKEEPLRASDHQLDLDLAEGKTKVSKVFDVKLKPNDYIVTKKGTVVKIIEEDLANMDYTKIERLATQSEINDFELSNTKK